MSLSRLGCKRHCGFSVRLLALGDASYQVVRRGSCEEELLHSANNYMSELEANVPAPAKPSADCSPS